jgi:DNA polymerase-3 subunit delta
MSQLRAEQLGAQLRRGLAPLYFIHGDETLRVNECADAVRAAARAQGFTDREVFSAEAGFDWNSLRAACDSLSLFSEKRLLELRLPSGKPGREGTAALREYATRPPEDRVLLILSAKLEPGARKSQWVQALDKAGVGVAIWPIEAPQLPAWIARRMRQHGMTAERDALQLLAERVEGNLLAAAQEIEKLYLLHGSGVVDLETVTELVMDSARYDIFGLVDKALAGEIVAVQRVLAGLRAEGVDPVLVLWALAREIRALGLMAAEVDKGAAAARVLTRHRVWEKRKPLITAALQRIHPLRWRRWLQRCAGIDRVIKGRSPGSCWDELLQLSLELAGLSPVGKSARQ